MKKIFIFVAAFLLVAAIVIVLLTTQQNVDRSLNVAATETKSAPAPAAASATEMPENVSTLPPNVIAGVVLTDEGPMEGATIRVRATENETLSLADGSFSLTVLSSKPISVTAWVDGYFGGAATVTPGLEPITITLQKYHTTDNLDYRFVSAEACGACHPNYAEWQADAHSQSAVNARFLSMYTGEDVNGNEATIKRGVNGLPLPPEPGEPYYGAGFKIDYPNRSGNCASCHTPMAASLDTTNSCGWSGCHSELVASVSDEIPTGISPTHLYDVPAEGINCDFCHKIGNVILDEETNLPWAAKTGISSMEVYRPPEDSDVFFGTLDDAPGRDSYLPLQEESAFCAPCHYGVFDGVVGTHKMADGVQIYNSYGEWLDSPYSNSKAGQTCQDCHMPANVDYDYIVYPDMGGFIRDPNTIHNHQMRGLNDDALMKNSVTMATTATATDDNIVVNVSITNDKTGHHVPTGSPLRQMLLVVEARDANGDIIALNEGAVLPDWTGDLSGKPGQYYAKILEDEWTGEIPASAFWRSINLVEDTRLPAMAADTTTYLFDLPSSDGPVTVIAKLVFRRAFQKLMDEKGWDDPDILMAEETVTVEK